MLWELRSEPTPWSFSICLRTGQGLNLGSTGLRCVQGSMMYLCTLLKSKAKLYAYLCLSGLRFKGKLWILRRAVTSNLWSPCSWVLLSVLSSKCVFPPTSHISSSGDAVSDKVTATPSWSFPHLGVEPASELGCPRESLGCRGPGCPQTPLGVTESVMESPLAERRWNFGLGAGTFLHLMCGSFILDNRWEVEKSWVEWSLLFPVPVWDGALCQSGWHCLTHTAQLSVF